MLSTYYVNTAVDNYKNDYWIGAVQVKVPENNFTWINGESFSNFQWRSGEPNNFGGPEPACVYTYWKYSQYLDRECIKVQEYVCEKALD